MSLTTTDARALVLTALRTVAPETDTTRLTEDTELRDAAELDSLDFLSFVELLSQRTGTRIEEEDYPRLRTLASAVAFLAEDRRGGQPGKARSGLS